MLSLWKQLMVFFKFFSILTELSFCHLRNIGRVRLVLSRADKEKLIHNFISSRLCYCKTILSGVSKKAIGQLQLVQNTAARVVTTTQKERADIPQTPILKLLHWLNVCQDKC